MSENVYEDEVRARSYAQLDFPGTYYLAFRDLPGIIGAHTQGTRALDFGCGTGRSTRFLTALGFETTGIDISSAMIRQARLIDPAGLYLHVAEGEFGPLDQAPFDLILSAFAFDNIPGVTQRRSILRGIRSLLKPLGVFVLLGSTPDIYINEWASFTTRDFPENADAKSGESVKIVMKDVADARPVIDQIWFDEDYRELFRSAEMEVATAMKPLGRIEEPVEWISETRVAPWVIYVAKPTT